TRFDAPHQGLLCFVFISSVKSDTFPDNFSLPIESPNKCFVGQFKFDFDVKYPLKDGTYKTVNFVVDNSTYINYNGSCSQMGDNTTHTLTIYMVANSWYIDLIFNLNKSIASLQQTAVAMVIDNATFPNVDTTLFGNYKVEKNVLLFKADQGNSFRCNSKTIVVFDTQKNITVTLDMHDVHVQAFYDNSQPFTGYGVEIVCADDMKKDSNLIPIVVGICLAVLVVIVLVAYLIGRRRCRNVKA
ncbi:unnamed protein product, partial [Didymodactylos carnosus]